MRTLKVILIITTILSVLGNLHSQQCKGFYQSRYCRLPDAQDYKVYGKSRSAYVVLRKSYQYEVVLTDKNDYKIGVCVSQGLGPVQFKLIEKETGNVIYDNEPENDVLIAGFSVVDKPLTIIIEISVQATKFSLKDFNDMKTCIGIQILYQKISKTGF